MSIAGTLKTVERLSREKVIELHNSIYSTNNLVFCAVGDAKWEDVLAEANKFPKTLKKIKYLNIIPSNKSTN